MGKWMTYLMQQYKRGWNEIPMVVLGGHFFVAAVIATPFVLHYKTKNIHLNRYKFHHFVVRPDDPRLEGTMRAADSPQGTHF